MARRDPQNRTEFWRLPELAGIEFLHARYETHTFSPHVHEELVIGVTEGGAGYFATNGRDHIATRRSLVIFNPDEPHHGGVVEGREWQYRALYLDPGALAAFGEKIMESDKVRYFSSNNVFDERLVEHAIAVHRASREDATGLELESSLIDLLAGIMIRHGDPAPRLPKCGQEQQAVNRIREYIHAHYAMDVNLKDLATIAQMSEFQVLRAFRKETGLTPHVYLNQVRLVQSKQLISSGLSMTDVANTVGFFDQSHLVRHFKRSYGFTPGQYADEINRHAQVGRELLAASGSIAQIAELRTGTGPAHSTAYRNAYGSASTGYAGG